MPPLLCVYRLFSLSRVQANMSPQTQNNPVMNLVDAVVNASVCVLPTAPVGSDILEVVPPFQGHSQLPRETYQAAVDAPTPPGRWFTPRDGWPQDVEFAGGTPLDLMPRASAVDDDFYVPERDALGELRLELLETDAMPSMDGHTER